MSECLTTSAAIVGKMFWQVGGRRYTVTLTSLPRLQSLPIKRNIAITIPNQTHSVIHSKFSYSLNQSKHPHIQIIEVTNVSQRGFDDNPSNFI